MNDCRVGGEFLMRWISVAVALAVLASAGVASAQPAENAATLAGPPAPRRGGLVFHVSGGGGQPTVVSLGLVDENTGGAVLRQRRQMQPDCTWAKASDLVVEAQDVVPLQNPRRLGGAERFGAYYATLFGALTTSQGSAATATQQSCVRQTMTQVGESLLRRQAASEGSSVGASLPGE
jgi:hypothetical protein